MMSVPEYVEMTAGLCRFDLRLRGPLGISAWVVITFDRLLAYYVISVGQSASTKRMCESNHDGLNSDRGGEAKAE